MTSKDESEVIEKRPAPRYSSTQAIHVGYDPDMPGSGAVVPPIVLSTTFKMKSSTSTDGYSYGRIGNPTRDILEKCLAAIEGAKYAYCYSSGIAATVAIVHLLHAGDHVVCTENVYGGTYRYLTQVAIQCMNIQLDFVDFTNLDKVKSVIRKNTKLVWLETPSNPTMTMVDLAAVVKVVKETCDALVAVDNTYMSPFYQKPLDFGVDLSMNSVTKYLNGHCDVIMGSVTLNNEKIAERLNFLQKAIGSTPSPFDCYMVDRSIKTLHVRMAEHMRSGLIVARALEENSRVDKVLHPGLPSHPHYELGRRQMTGYSGVFAIYVKGNGEQTNTFLENLKVIQGHVHIIAGGKPRQAVSFSIFVLASSLGGTESIVCLPWEMSHTSMSESFRLSIGVTDNLVRLSIGLEDPQDLIADIDQALRAAIPE